MLNLIQEMESESKKFKDELNKRYTKKVKLEIKKLFSPFTDKWSFKFCNYNNSLEVMNKQGVKIAYINSDGISFWDCCFDKLTEFFDDNLNTLPEYEDEINELIKIMKYLDIVNFNKVDLNLELTIGANYETKTTD